MKLRLSKRPIWRGAIYFAATLLILAAIDQIYVQRGRQIMPGFVTTRITEPKLPDGRIDYFTALEHNFSAGVTFENNAMPLMLEALGPTALPPNQPRNGITARLGMPPLPETGDYFKTRLELLSGYPKALNADDPQNDIEPLMAHPWNAAANPQFAAWLAANVKPLAKLTEAAKRPRYFMPLNGGLRPETLADISLPHLAPLREMGHALVCRAMFKAGSLDFAGARDDLMTAHQLAGLLGQGSTLPERLVALKIDDLASFAEIGIAIDGQLNAAQAKAWIVLEKIPPLRGFSDAIDITERYMFLDTLQLAASKGLPKLLSFYDPPGSNNSVAHKRFMGLVTPMQYGHAMASGNTWYDRLVAAYDKPTGMERRNAIAVVQKDFATFIANTKPWQVVTSSDWPIAIFMQGIIKLSDQVDVPQTKRNLALTAMALAAYHAEHGDYPTTLDALKFAVLPQIPTDPFSGKPFVYRGGGDVYLLYSIGPNALDDGGVRQPDGTQAKSPDDISVSVGWSSAKARKPIKGNGAGR